tara:strand:- start:1057 stop:4308 length:3252 start_codon:yes stop_codon:yes gene_type:complete
MKKGIIPWFVHNGVAANMLLAMILVAGIMMIPNLKKEIFPEFSIDIVTVSLVYRGAAPAEVEEGVCVRIEEAIQDIDGIKEIQSLASEGLGTVTVEIEPGYDTRKALDDIKARVDAIDTFPDETDKPVVREITSRFQVVNVSISGETDLLTLKKIAEQAREEIIALPEVTQAEIVNAPPYEISIELSEEAMRRHGLTFDAVAMAVRRSSLDLPGGSVKTETGEILLRTKGQAYRGTDFETLPLINKSDGTKLVLGDVARVVDGFAETDQWSRFDGKPSMMVQVYRVGDQSALEVADAVKEWVTQAGQRAPEGIVYTIWNDGSKFLRGRIDLMLRNAQNGLILVFVVLALFLRMRLAMWVTIGIPVSFLGAIMLMPVLDVSVNMVSLFSFILVLGIVVDDAIVVGESIFTQQEMGVSGVKGAVEGARRVAVPVTFGVLTTMVAFAPMLFVPGWNGKIWRVIPLIIIPTLFFSLIESKFVLPHHLSFQRHKSPIGKRHFIIRIWNGFFNLFSDGLVWFVRHAFQPALKVALEWRYLTVAVAISMLLITVGLVGGGHIKIVFFPKVENDFISAPLTMPLETPAQVTEEAVRRIEDSALELQRVVKEETGDEVLLHVLTSVGDQPFVNQSQRFAGGPENASQAHLGEVAIELAPSQTRNLTSAEVAARWREMSGSIPGAVELKFNSDLMNQGGAIDIQFTSHNIELLRDVGEKTKAKLAEYPGVFDITDSLRGGKPEVKLAITSNAEALGLSLEQLARQVRQGFYGEEVQRIQRGRDDIRVMVRYPERDRESLGDLEAMRVRTAGGVEVPFSTVAEAELGRGFASIRRVNRRRSINVTADVDTTVGNANEILTDMTTGFLNPLVAQTPGLDFRFEGQQREQMESMSGLATGFIGALCVIYTLMAIPFRSYIQPLIVMTAVPFGIVGAVWGHVIMDLPISMLSMCGIVALTGIVVNDSLVLVSYVNTLRSKGNSIVEAAREGASARFRAIILTSLTTAAGVMPLMLEKEVQAQFLIPMAVALVYGVLFSTVITLVLVPSSYLILEDLRRLCRWWWQGVASNPVDTSLPESSSSSSVGSVVVDEKDRDF